MILDRRKKTNVPEFKPTSLPVDYLTLSAETLTTALEPGLIEFKKIQPTAKFLAFGTLFSDEIVIGITLSQGEQHLAATTVFASVDFDPQTQAAMIEDLLSKCLDAIGTVYEFYLDPKSPEKIAQLANHSLSALEEAPFEWSKVESVWVKLDKSNPVLDELTEKWLLENDPEYSKDALEEESAEFLKERLDAIKRAQSGSSSSGGSGGFGSSGGDSGPIRH